MNPSSSSNDTTIVNLNGLLRGEISAVETYDQAIPHLGNEPVADLIANRDCHDQRVTLLRQRVAEQGGVPDAGSGLWGGLARLVEQGAALISAKAVIATLEEGEDRGLAMYRHPGDLDPSAIQFIHTVLLPRQLETHERMRLRKLAMA